MKFIFDLDGTICFKGQPLSDAMVQALDFLVEKGHEIIFASARPIRDLLPILPSHMHHFPMVGGNGGFVATGGTILSTIAFDPATAASIIGLIRSFEAEYLIDSKWDYAYSGSEEHPIRRNLDPQQRATNIGIDELTEIIKVVILHSLDGQKMLEELLKLPIVIYRHASEDIIDISPLGIDKWTGLQKLGIMPQEFIAFGNDANDVSMFKHAKRAICVGDHADLLLLTAEQVINKEAHVINKIITLMEGLEMEGTQHEVSLLKC
ncbi:HAD-IIB family hydrolase [Paenibacillus herberti]|uniref:HAD family hydrolase n=1 Tax=Paenibacillus herberti TaxID=1619309 RepID=A0A229NX03_9BACL|nr:HAD family hydrolase [Paenibacillus herberti]OXM14430.1 HAD family hydrolase [Paenibacillus herberti]